MISSCSLRRIILCSSSRFDGPPWWTVSRHILRNSRLSRPTWRRVTVAKGPRIRVRMCASPRVDVPRSYRAGQAAGQGVSRVPAGVQIACYLAIPIIPPYKLCCCEALVADLARALHCLQPAVDLFRVDEPRAVKVSLRCDN